MSRLAELVDGERVVSELRELDRLTADGSGAQRVCWTPTWRLAREWMGARLDGLADHRRQDAAGNSWAVVSGEDESRSILIGGHIDSVPNGGWLDGALNLVAGIEVLRAIASRGVPPVNVALVDWADEEGARFGRGLVGSSAASGTLDPAELVGLRDRDGVAMTDALAEFGVELASMLDARRELDGAVVLFRAAHRAGPCAGESRSAARGGHGDRRGRAARGALLGRSSPRRLDADGFPPRCVRRRSPARSRPARAGDRGRRPCDDRPLRDGARHRDRDRGPCRPLGGPAPPGRRGARIAARRCRTAIRGDRGRGGRDGRVERPLADRADRLRPRVDRPRRRGDRGHAPARRRGCPAVRFTMLRKSPGRGSRR